MSTSPYFPNSAFVRAPERFVLRGGRWKSRNLAVRYGRFEHPDAGTCIIDTGYSKRVTAGRRSPFLWLYANILRPKLDAEALPGTGEKVDAILLSHLHADHVSALRDYPEAKIFAAKSAVIYFLNSTSFNCIRHGVFKELFPDDFLDRIVDFDSLEEVSAPLGLGTGRDLFDDGTVLAIALPGHMLGHYGFLWPKLKRPVLYAADAQWLRKAVLESRSPGPPAKWIMHDPIATIETGKRIAAFEEKGGQVFYCHDPEPLKPQVPQ